MRLLKQIIYGHLSLDKMKFSTETNERIYNIIMEEVSMDEFTQDGVYGAGVDLFNNISAMQEIIPESFLVGKFVSMTQMFESEYEHPTLMDEVWFRKGKKRYTTTFDKDGYIDVKTQVMLEVRNGLDSKNPNAPLNLTNPYDAISCKVVGNVFGSMGTMQDTCIEIVEEFPGVEVAFYGTAWDSTRRLVVVSKDKIKIRQSKSVDRTFRVEIIGRKVTMRECFSHRANPGVLGEEADAGWATVRTAGARPKRLRSVQSRRFFKASKSAKPSEVPPVEFEEFEDGFGEDSDGSGCLGIQMGPWGGEGGFGTDL